MRCPLCRHTDSRVVDSRASEDGAVIRRRRECLECKQRFTTTESAALFVLKRSGTLEPFSRAKVVAGLAKACQGRPVSTDDLERLAQQVEETIRSTGVAQVETGEIGRTILEPLKELDVVAYLRFASVYSGFNSLEDFEAAIESLRKENRF